MARGGTSMMAGGVYHVISRFVAKDWFIESSVERRQYLALLDRALAKTDWRLFAYALMSSHVHLALVMGTQPLRDWLRPMHTEFAKWINWRRERIGAVFVRGPNVIQVWPDGARRLIGYIHQNPVRGRVVADVADSDWTSHRAYVGLATPPTCLDVEAGLALAACDSGQELAAWMQETRTTKRDLEKFRVRPVSKPGRPRMPTLRAKASRLREPAAEKAKPA